MALCTRVGRVLDISRHLLYRAYSSEGYSGSGHSGGGGYGDSGHKVGIFNIVLAVQWGRSQW